MLRAFISEGDCVRIHSLYRVSLCFVVILTVKPLVKTAVLDLVLFFLLLMHQLGVTSAPGRKVSRAQLIAQLMGSLFK